MKINNSTSNEKINVHITCKDGPAPKVLRGYAYQTDSGKKLPGSDSTHNITVDEELEAAIEQLTARICGKCKRKGTYSGKSSSKKMTRSSVIVKAFEDLERNKTTISSWKETTQQTYMSYFKNNILPYISLIEDDVDVAEFNQGDMITKLIDKSKANKNSYDSIENAANNVNVKMKAANLIFEAMREINPTIPAMTFDEGMKKPRKTKTQIKSLSFDIIVKLRKDLEKIVKKEPRHVRAAVAMEAGGLRTSEACAITKNNIWVGSDYAIISVTEQVSSNGKSTKSLKSKAGYRKVVVDRWAKNIFEQANAAIKKEDDKVIKSSEFSNWLKEKMYDAGCDKAFLDKQWQAMGKEGILSELSSRNEITAYCLRRTRCSLWINTLALPHVIVDYMLGHKTNTSNSKKITLDDEEIVLEIARKINRMVDCKNEILIDKNSPREIKPCEKNVIINPHSEKQKIRVVVSPAEPGEAIILRTSKEPSIKQTLKPKCPNGTRSNTEVIGNMKFRKGDDIHEK